MQDVDVRLPRNLRRVAVNVGCTAQFQFYHEDSIPDNCSIPKPKVLKALLTRQKNCPEYCGGKWILFENARIIHSRTTQEELEAKIWERKDSDCYRPADFVAFVPLHVEDLPEQAPAKPKSEVVMAVAEIFQAATDREKLEIFKEICDLGIQSIGIEFPEE